MKMKKKRKKVRGRGDVYKEWKLLSYCEKEKGGGGGGGAGKM